MRVIVFTVLQKKKTGGAFFSLHLRWDISDCIGLQYKTKKKKRKRNKLASWSTHIHDPAIMMETQAALGTVSSSLLNTVTTAPLKILIGGIKELNNEI